MRRRLLVVVALLVGAFAFIGVPGASGAIAAPPGPPCPGANPYSGHQAIIMASTTTPFIGQTFEASGIDYCPNEDVNITLRGVHVATAHTNGAGAFEPPVVATGPAGQAELCGIGATGQPNDRDCLELTIRAAAPNSNPPLSFTGVEIGAMIAVAILLLVGGTLFATAGRRRRHAHGHH
jgi:hypothetical protein